MWLNLFYILSLIFSASSIKVQVEASEDNDKGNSQISKSDDIASRPIYYVSDDAVLDSYLIPPDPHKPEEVLPDSIVTPATYLLPPTREKQTDHYYTPTEPGEQTDWYPIAQSQPQQQSQTLPPLSPNNNETEVILTKDNPRRGRAQERIRNILPIPSDHLEPPLVNAPNDYLTIDNSESEHSPEEISLPKLNYELPLTHNNQGLLGKYRPAKPTLALHLIPPQQQFLNYKNPTKLYPKKFPSEYKPVPIPLSQFADESLLEVPKAKPVKVFKPYSGTEIDFLTPPDDKNNYLYQKAEQKRKLKGDIISQGTKLPDIPLEDTYGQPIPTEQETSETNYRHPGRNIYPVPLRKPAPTPQKDTAAAPAPDERTEFRMHGMKGPHSYQFGYDTGKGKNRQFRYEERDNDGQVRGHYGYMDKHGKLRVVNYSAHPDSGFHAEAPVEKE